MPKTTNYADNLFKLFNTNIAYAGIGDAPGLQPSASPGDLYISLHTGDPGLTGSQLVNEASYTGYGRVAVARSAAGWTVSTNQVTNFANITFNPCSGGSSLVTWFGLGTDSAGAGQLLYAFPLIQTYYEFYGDSATDKLFNLSGLAANTPIQVVTNPGGTLPSALSQGTTYFVKTTSADGFTVSATAGGLLIPLVTTGFGMLGQESSLAVSPGITPQFLAGQLIISEV
jgi:hypothetical protein